MTGTLSVEYLSGTVSVCGGSMVGITVADGRVTECIVGLVTKIVPYGVLPVRQSIGKKLHHLIKSILPSLPLGSWMSTSMLFSIPLP